MKRRNTLTLSYCTSIRSCLMLVSVIEREIQQYTTRTTILQLVRFTPVTATACSLARSLSCMIAVFRRILNASVQSPR